MTAVAPDPTVAPPETAERIRFRLTVATANVGRKYRGRWRVRRNIALVLRTFAGAVIGWQEIDEADPADEHGILTDLARKFLRLATAAHRKLARVARRGWRQVGFAQHCPLSLPRSWPLLSADVKPACQGREHVTPNRVIVIGRTRLPVVEVEASFLNGHLPFNAPDLWAIAVAAWVRAVALEVDANRIVFITMDSNHHGPTPQLHPRQRILVGESDIDKVIVILPRLLQRAGVKVDLVRLKSANLDIDGHDADGAVVEVSVPPAFHQL